MANRDRRSSRGLAVLLALIVALVGGAWFVMIQEQDASVAGFALEATGLDQESTTVPQGTSLEALVNSQGGGDPVEPEIARREVDSSPTASPMQPADKPVLAFAGQFVEYGNGAPRAMTFDGSVGTKIWVAGRGRSTDVPVVGGRFEVHLTRGGGDWRASGWDGGLSGDAAEFTLRVQAPTSSEGAAFVLFDPEQGVLTARTEPIPFGTLDAVVAVRRAAAVELDVLAMDSGVHLDNVEVRASKQYFMQTVDPAEQNLVSLVEKRASPVLLSPSGHLAVAGRVDLAVGAEGYAWAKLTVDFRETHKRSIRLEPAGSLRAELTGEVPPRAKIRLRRDGRLASERRAKGSEVLYDHLAPGRYEVNVELGVRYESPLVLATAWVDVHAGVQGEVLLDVQPLEPVTKASVRGRIHLPEEWAMHTPVWRLQRTSPSLRGKALNRNLSAGEAFAIEGRAGWYTLEIDRLEAGSYALVLSGLSFAVAFDLPPEGLADLLIEVPPPVEFSVLLQDASSGADVPEIETILWSPPRAEGVHGRGIRSVKRDPEMGRFLLRVPACEITVSASNPAYTHDKLSLVPVDGQAVVLEVRARPSLSIDLRCGEERIPWSYDSFPRLTNEQGEPARASYQYGNDAFLLGADKPGTYLVQIPKLSGYLPVDPVKVDLELGPRQSLVIQLVPE